MFQWLKDFICDLFDSGNDWIDPWTYSNSDDLFLGVILDDTSCLADCLLIIPPEDDVRLAAYYLWLSDVEARLPEQSSEYYWFKAQFNLTQQLNVAFSTCA